MTGRTFVIGDIHGDLDALRTLVAKMPTLTETDTLVFLGDYVDRGPESAQVIRVVRAIQRDSGFKTVCLRGNHEDAWLRVIEKRWDEFVFPPSNGCLATMRSFTGGPVPKDDELAAQEEIDTLFTGGFFPADVIEWMKNLPWWHEDEHGIYVHAGLVQQGDTWLHPKDTPQRSALLWTRTQAFFRDYRGKRVVVGHTATDVLPPELSKHTPDDPTDLWAGEAVIAIDTSAGKGGFLTAVELPALRIWESRSNPALEEANNKAILAE